MMKKIFIFSAVLFAVFAYGQQAKALSYSSLVLGQQAYQTTTLFKASNLTLSVTPYDYSQASGKWNYRVNWNRMTNRGGSIYINGNVFMSDASGSGSNFTGFNLSPRARYRLTYYSQSNGRGVRIVNRYFTTLTAPVDDIDDIDDGGDDDIIIPCPVFDSTNPINPSASSSAAPTMPRYPYPPCISRISPSSGPVGAAVIIYGSRVLGTAFDLQDNYINFAGVERVAAAASPDGFTLKFVIPYSVSENFYCTMIYPNPNCLPTAARLITPGTYSFSVTNSNGTSNSVNFTVTPEAAGAIKVLSPNGGEVWQKGTVQAINWQDNRPYSCPVGANCILAARFYDITLSAYYPPCTGNICPMYPYPAPYTIARKVSGASYLWNVGGSYFEGDAGRLINNGLYTIQVCESGTGICDSSDLNFKITSPASTNNPPVINGISGPTALKPGEAGTWTVAASDPENGSLSYSVDWGDSAGRGAAAPSADSFLVSQNATFTHSYASPGTYTVAFTVTDSLGLAAKTSISVSVFLLALPN